MSFATRISGRLRGWRLATYTGQSWRTPRNTRRRRSAASATNANDSGYGPSSHARSTPRSARQNVVSERTIAGSARSGCASDA